MSNFKVGDKFTIKEAALSSYPRTFRDSTAAKVYTAIAVGIEASPKHADAVNFRDDVGDVVIASDDTLDKVGADV